MTVTDYTLAVLRCGWSREFDSNCFTAGCTVTLLQGPKVILVDPGGPWDTIKIIALLADQGLTVADVDYVICTHEHVDHVGSLHCFVNAIQIIGTTVYKNGYTHHEFLSGHPYEIDSAIKVVHTPGHTLHDVSVIAEGVLSYGRVAIAGDLFESKEDIRNPRLWQNSSMHIPTQERYRIQMLEKTDLVVPGHGPPFNVTNELRTMASGTQKLSPSKVSDVLQSTTISII